MMFERGTIRRWRLTQDITWHVGRKGNGYPITIHAGREFESSVPFFARWWLSRDDPRFLLAALVHDHMLEVGIYGRGQAAAEWFDGAIAGGAPATKAKIAAVGIFIWALFRPGAV